MSEAGEATTNTAERALSETIQSVDLKEQSSVHSYSKNSIHADRRAKRYGRPIFRCRTHKANEEVTKVLYVKELGVIVAGYYGVLRVLDPMTYQDTLSTNAEKHPPLHTITALDYSKKHGLIAMGGVEGKLIMYDTMAEGPCGSVNTGSELLDIYFFDEQLQLIAITANRYISIYDSNRLECL